MQNTINSSDDIGAPGRDNLFGRGRINMWHALAGLPGIRVSHRKMIIKNVNSGDTIEKVGRTNSKTILPDETNCSQKSH